MRRLLCALALLVVSAAASAAPSACAHALSARAPAVRRSAIAAMLRSDEQWMAHALQLAERGRRTAPPNPWVGSVIVAADGATILGEGYHVCAGGPHAEAAALADACARGVSSEALAGATIYVTLEPCHAGPGKRTPACDEAIVAAGIRRVVLALLDPDPIFGGAGLKWLRSRGVAVEVGAGGAAAAASLEPYLHQRRTKRPFCVLKTALSIDGAVACEDGSSRWITGPEARADAHRIRAYSQAVIVGAGTALRDEPRLTWRAEGGEAWARADADGAPAPQPLRVVLDTNGRLLGGPLLDTAEAPTLVLTSAELCDPDALRAWDRAGVEHEVVPLATLAGAGAGCGGARGLHLPAVLDALGRRGILQAMWEGGPHLHASLLQQDLADELVVYVGNCLLGSSALPWAQGPLARTIGEKREWALRSCEALGQDVRITYARRPKPGTD
ncbi:dihydrofolate reductase-like domain-containing protein [Pavlovales sp. CCMP2436]|nr:dihydrofolate reductase-like domain-containing protein [Pavlovales sp. CCMP2436]